MIKKIAAIALGIASMAAQAQHGAPEGYAFLTEGSGGSVVYAHFDSMKPQRFTDKANNSRLAVGNFWSWPKGSFHRVVANCETYAISQVTADEYGGERATKWTPSIEGTIAHMMAGVMCLASYPPSKPSRNSSL